ncbi:Large-conductance mechanosensitive channel [bioreactor metagenome]|uniref:Large-conductance mechanosensitive channel n=1 Tax=bioreactor metagenome TaxID=1076179 RepID=A0A645J4W9_9ZZZZ
MKKLFSEFKAFIAKGSVIDLAVGVIIGAAFKGIVDSLVSDIISPLIGLIANTNFTDLVWQIGGVSIKYGSFITAIINFLLMAIVLFLIVKAISATREIGGKLKKNGTPVPVEPTEKTCPYCKSKIAIDATRCPHCTSEVK